MNNVNSRSPILRKLDLIDKINNYASLVFPISSTSQLAKLSALGAFNGDSPDVPKSYNIALGNALGAYTPILAAGMLPVPPGVYVPLVIPQSFSIIPQLITLVSVTDNISQIQLMSTMIDSWFHTGISLYNIVTPPSSVPTPWI
jgi:hypothetical protein